ncbi:MAG: hypothetical protein NE328_05380 [Lentisphaeraceae bacterium]|nr:hypothetical protein [Lentisphaeraceae bacterium]
MTKFLIIDKSKKYKFSSFISDSAICRYLDSKPENNKKVYLKNLEAQIIPLKGYSLKSFRGSFGPMAVEYKNEKVGNLIYDVDLLSSKPIKSFQSFKNVFLEHSNWRDLGPTSKPFHQLIYIEVEKNSRRYYEPIIVDIRTGETAVDLTSISGKPIKKFFRNFKCGDFLAIKLEEYCEGFCECLCFNAATDEYFFIQTKAIGNEKSYIAPQWLLPNGTILFSTSDDPSNSVYNYQNLLVVNKSGEMKELFDKSDLVRKRLNVLFLENSLECLELLLFKKSDVVYQKYSLNGDRLENEVVDLPSSLIRIYDDFEKFECHRSDKSCPVYMTDIKKGIAYSFEPQSKRVESFDIPKNFRIDTLFPSGLCIGGIDSYGAQTRDILAYFSPDGELPKEIDILCEKLDIIKPTQKSNSLKKKISPAISKFYKELEERDFFREYPVKLKENLLKESETLLQGRRARAEKFKVFGYELCEDAQDWKFIPNEGDILSIFDDLKDFYKGILDFQNLIISADEDYFSVDFTLWDQTFSFKENSLTDFTVDILDIINKCLEKSKFNKLKLILLQEPIMYFLVTEEAESILEDVDDFEFYFPS